MNSTDLDRLNILLVDDQPQKLLAYEAMLGDLGQTLLRAQSGNEAFELLLQEDIAAILLDVNMPGMDGFETAAMIRQHPRFTKTPIIFVTAVNTTDLDRMRGYEIGAVDYVAVPVIPEILRAKVSVFVELHRKRRELERANLSLLESEQRMRAVLETANDAIVTIDAQGTILTANHAAERIFGYGIDELIGASIKKLVPAPWDRSYETTTVGEINGQVAALAGMNQEFQGQRKDGSVVALELAVSEAMPGTLFTAIIRDLSRRRQLEREVTEIAAAEQRRIGQELHDGVSQELTGLTMMAAALRDRVNKLLPATDGLSDRIIDGLARVQKQVRQVSHGLIPVELDAEGLRAALEELADRVRQQAGIACEFSCPQRVLLKDSLTATHLFHIVQEATNNALRHGRPQRIDIRLNIRHDALVLTIRDDGIGMGHAPSRPNGVGLRLMRYRASLIGGILHVAPNETQGTLVSCTVPDWQRADAAN